MKPFFTVILTTFNRCHLLPRAIRSVLTQSFRDFQLIIIDDHSIDHTSAIVAEFVDNRLEYQCLPHNKGISAARNRGIQCAQGTYIIFLDDDDAFFPHFLESSYNFINKQAVPFKGFIFPEWKLIFESNNLANEKVGTQTYRIKLDKKKYFLEKMRCFCGTIFHRDSFNIAGQFNEGLRKSEDRELLFRMLVKKIPVLTFSNIGVKVYIHPFASLSRSKNCQLEIESQQQFLSLIEKHIDKSYQPLWIRLNLSLLGTYYHNGLYKPARDLAKKLLKQHFIEPRIWEMLLRFELIKPIKKLFAPFLNTKT